MSLPPKPAKKSLPPKPAKADNWHIQLNRSFDSKSEIEQYALDRGATIKEIWPVEVYRCVLIMPLPKNERKNH